MQTRILKPEQVEEGARILREGGLLAIPTETVYGLGANGLDPKAVRAIFEAKGRPQIVPRWSYIEPERCAPRARASPEWMRHCKHTPVIFVCSIPPSLQRD